MFHFPISGFDFRLHEESSSSTTSSDVIFLSAFKVIWPDNVLGVFPIVISKFENYVLVMTKTQDHSVDFYHVHRLDDEFLENAFFILDEVNSSFRILNIASDIILVGSISSVQFGLLHTNSMLPSLFPEFLLWQDLSDRILQFLIILNLFLWEPIILYAKYRLVENFFRLSLAFDNFGSIAKSMLTLSLKLLIFFTILTVFQACYIEK